MHKIRMNKYLIIKHLILIVLACVLVCMLFLVKSINEFPQFDIDKESLYGNNNENLKEFRLGDEGYIISESDDPWIYYSLEKATNIKIVKMVVDSVSVQDAWGELHFILEDGKWEHQSFFIHDGVNYIELQNGIENVSVIRFDFVSMKDVSLRIESISVNTQNKDMIMCCYVVSLILIILIVCVCVSLGFVNVNREVVVKFVKEKSCLDTKGTRKSLILFISKTLIILIATKVATKYWMIPQTSIFLLIVSVLIYSWNQIGFGKNKKQGVLVFGACLLSISVVITYMVNSKFILNRNIKFFLAELPFLILHSWILLNSILMLLEWISTRDFLRSVDASKVGIKKNFNLFIVSAFIFIMWIPYFLTWYPCLIFGDSLNSIYQSIGRQNWNNHFPIAYTLFIKLFIHIGIALGDINIGYAMYTLVQMLVISFLLGYTICWIQNKGFFRIAVIGCLYYAFVPWFPQHAVAMWKDGIFSAFLLFMCVQLLDLVISKGRILQNKSFCAKSIISAIVVCAFRNNGVYVIAFFVVCMCLYTFINKENFSEKVRYVVYHCMVIMICFIVTGPIYRAVGIDDDEVEKYGILLQQIARTVTERGNIAEDEYQFLDELLPIEFYDELYNPQLVDSIKWDEHFNTSFLEENQGKFIITWFKLMLKNPKIYVKAYLEMTYQYWVPNAWENNIYRMNITLGNPDAAETNSWWEDAEVRHRNILENERIDTKQLFSISTPMISVGILVWLMIIVILYASIKNKLEYILTLNPVIGALITLFIAAPIGYWPRYMLVLYYVLPVLVYMVLVIGKGSKKDGKIWG